MAGWFYAPTGPTAGERFPLILNPLPRGIHYVARYGAWVLGAGLGFGLLWATLKNLAVMGLSKSAWLFLFVGLLVLPGLLANTILKDHWGRARPVQVEEFGGTAKFSPPAIIAGQCDKNCSFVAGDPSFAFYLCAFAYVVRRKYSRMVFLGGVMAGAVVGVARMAAGGHFFSDVVFSGVLMLFGMAALYAAMFGMAAAKERWRDLMPFLFVR